MNWLTHTHDWLENDTPAWLQTIMVLGAAWVVAGGLHLLVLRLIRHNPYLRGYGDVAKRVARRVSLPTHLLLLLLTLQVALPFAAIPDAWEPRIARLLMPLSVAALGWLFIALAHGVDDWAGERFAWKAGEDNIQARRITTQLHGVMRAVNVLLIALTIIGVAMTIPSLRNLGLSLFASAGVAGIAIGVAAQKTLGNLVAGVQMAITQPIRLGDAVVVENQSATVEEMASSFVVLRTWDDRRLIVPLSYFIENTFENWTHTSSELLGGVMLYVDYTMPLAPIREEFDRLMNASKLWDRRAKAVQVTNMTETHLEIRLKISAADSGKLTDLSNFIREQMVNFLRLNYSEYLPLSRQLASDLDQFDKHIKRSA